MTSSVVNLQKRVAINKKAIRELIEFVLKKENVRKGGHITVTFLTDERIRVLNKRFLGHDYPTDVISFPLFCDKATLIADITVSADTACLQAQTFHTTPRKELYLYVVHGLIHLLGYNDHKRQDRARMHRRQSHLLEAYLAQAQ